MLDLLTIALIGAGLWAAWQGGTRYGWRKYLDAEDERWKELTAEPEWKKAGFAKRVDDRVIIRVNFARRAKRGAP